MDTYTISNTTQTASVDPIVKKAIDTIQELMTEGKITIQQAFDLLLAIRPDEKTTPQILPYPVEPYRPWEPYKPWKLNEPWIGEPWQPITPTYPIITWYNTNDTSTCKERIFSYNTTC